MYCSDEQIRYLADYFNKAEKALLSKDESKMVQMYDLALRVTDKPIDIEEIYKSYLDLKGTREKSEKTYFNDNGGIYAGNSSYGSLLLCKDCRQSSGGKPTDCANK